MGPYRCPVRFFVTYIDYYGDVRTLGQCDRDGCAGLIRNCRVANDKVIAVHEVLFGGKKVCRWSSRLHSDELTQVGT